MTIIITWRTSFVVNRFVHAKSLVYDYSKSEFVLTTETGEVHRYNPDLVLITILKEKKEG